MWLLRKASSNCVAGKCVLSLAAGFRGTAPKLEAPSAPLTHLQVYQALPVLMALQTLQLTYSWRAKAQALHMHSLHILLSACLQEGKGPVVLA